MPRLTTLAIASRPHVPRAAGRDAKAPPGKPLPRRSRGRASTTKRLLLVLLLAACKPRKPAAVEETAAPAPASTLVAGLGPSGLPPTPGGGEPKPALWGVSGEGNASVRGLVFDDAGALWLTGYYEGATTLGVASLQPRGAADCMVGRIGRDGSAHAIAWGGDGNDACNAIASNGTQIAIGGNVSHGLALPNHATLAGNGGDDAFVVVMDGQGQIAWALVFGGEGSDGVTAVAPLPDGWLIAGSFSLELRLGAHHLRSAGGTDGFVAALDARGNVRWAKRFGDIYDDAVYHLATTADTYFLQGLFAGTVELGASRHRSHAGNDADLLLMALTVDGKLRWSQAFGSTGNEIAGGLVALDDGGLAITGAFEQTLTLGDTRLTAQGAADGFVAWLDSSGEPQRAAQLGGPREDIVFALARQRDALVVAGWFTDALHAGPHTLRSAGNKDAFWARVGPDGQWQSADRSGHKDHDRIQTLASSPSGQLALGGNFRFRLLMPPLPTALIAHGTEAPAPPADGFVAVLPAPADRR